MQTKHSGSVLKQPFFDWNVPDKCLEMLIFEMEAMNIQQTKKYELIEKEKVCIIKIWVGRKTLQLIHTFMTSNKEVCKTAEGLYYILGEKLKPKHNETIQFLQ